LRDSDKSAAYSGLREAVMANPTGESESDAVRFDFDRRLMLQFRGSMVQQLPQRGGSGIYQNKRVPVTSPIMTSP
jgi:hypothetical protein